MVVALVLGLGVGGLGGFFGAGGKDATAASKDATAAGNGSAAVAAAPGAAVKGAPQAKPAQRGAPPPPGKPVYIPLMKSSPRHGPEHAKVTILDFSDFQ